MEDKAKVILEAMRRAGKPVRPGDIAKMTGINIFNYIKFADQYSYFKPHGLKQNFS